MEAVFDLATGCTGADASWPPTAATGRGAGRAAHDCPFGRGRAHLGGRLATLAELAGSVGHLVDITSQHDQQSLMDPESQLSILDAFAENGELIGRGPGGLAGAGRGAGGAGRLRIRGPGRAEREDYLRFQLAELDEAALVPGEDEALKSERERVRGAEKFLAVFARGEDALYAGDQAATGRLPPWPGTWRPWPSWTEPWPRWPNGCAAPRRWSRTWRPISAGWPGTSGSIRNG